MAGPRRPDPAPDGTGPPQLLPESWLRGRRAWAYYDVLNADQEFRADLARLGAHIPPAALDGEVHPSLEWRPVVQRFADRWHLPTYEEGRLAPAGLRAVWHSLWLAKVTKAAAPELFPGQMDSMGPPPQVIQPATPGPFEFDPTTQSRRWVAQQARRIGKNVEQDIIAQARRAEQVPGWGPVPPRHRDPVQLQRMARRLYRRAVQGMSYDEIAEQESQEGQEGETVAGETVRATVSQWARQLNVSLPEIGPGRRPKNR
jgi:hypothetical protein